MDRQDTVAARLEELAVSGGEIPYGWCGGGWQALQRRKARVNSVAKYPLRPHIPFRQNGCGTTSMPYSSIRVAGRSHVGR
jgi:hypothetical protein